jgi:hypothetical protein
MTPLVLCQCPRILRAKSSNPWTQRSKRYSTVTIVNIYFFFTTYTNDLYYYYIILEGDFDWRNSWTGYEDQDGK